MAVLTWAGGTSGTFSNPLNWNPQQVPNTTSDVVIDPTSATTVTATSDATINSLSMNSNGTLDIASTNIFAIQDVPDTANPTGTSSNAGTINLANGGDLQLAGTFDNSGLLATVANSDTWATSTFDNTGTVRQSGDLHVGNATTAGTFINESGARFTLTGVADIKHGSTAGSTFTNDGTFVHGGTGGSDVTVKFDNNGSLTVSGGRLNFLGGVANSGTMAANGAVLYARHAIGGTGKLDVSSGGKLIIASGVDHGQTVDFLSGGVLGLASPSTFAGTIEGFAVGDTIDLIKHAATSLSFSSGVLSVMNGSTTVASLHFSGSYTTSDFKLSSDLHNGALISHT